MAVISFQNVTKYYQLDLILDHISFQINKNEKIALIGDNGVGKTTIFKLILKEEEVTPLSKENNRGGDISILKDFTIGYLSQDAIKSIENTVRQELEEPFLGLKKLSHDFEEVSHELSLYPNDENVLKRYDEMLEKVENSRLFTYQNDIEFFISKFSFPLSILDKKVSELSGGERMKIAFIKLLLFRFDCLLLDEPTNHLDISTIEWLEEFLKNYQGTIIFISHDRYFIESVASKILELEYHKVSTYNMKYTDYLKEKEIRFNNALAKYQHEEEEMARLKRFIEFYMPKPRFVSRAKDRVKKLERLEKNHVVEPKKVNHNIKVNLEGGNLKNKLLLEVKNLVIGYDKPLLKDTINLELYGKDKVAIIGDNGIGKTTLIKTILGEIKPLNGEVIEKRVLKIGYIRQNDHSFKKGESILEHLQNEYPQKSEKELRTSLGSFLFRKEEVFKEVSTLSNGEKMRVNLCSLVLSSYDILILDEPTNHLDMVTKECLIKGLESYNGAILFISHDRYFINQLADFVLYLSKDENKFIIGNYDDFKYEDTKNEEVEAPKIIEEPVKEVKVEKKKTLSKNKIKELNDRLEEIDKEIRDNNLLLEKDDTPYNLLTSIQEEIESLEEEYLEILEQLNENQ